MLAGDKFKIISKGIIEDWQKRNVKYQNSIIDSDLIFIAEGVTTVDGHSYYVVKVLYDNLTIDAWLEEKEVQLLNMEIKSVLECTCESLNLAYYGCKCGYVAEMKKLGKDW